MPVTRHHGSNQPQHHIGQSARERWTALSQPEAHKARVSPTLKGALIGAVAGRLVPIPGIGSLSGAVLGGIAGKWLDLHQSNQQNALLEQQRKPKN